MKKVRFFTVCVLILALALSLGGCGGKQAGASVLDTDQQRFLWILCGANVEQTAQVTVRLIKLSNDGKTTVTKAEYTPARQTEKNVFGLVVEETGLYEITYQVEGYKPGKQMVIVDDNRVYTIVCNLEPVA
jgi:hypothetical protein